MILLDYKKAESPRELYQETSYLVGLHWDVSHAFSVTPNYYGIKQIKRDGILKSLEYQPEMFIFYSESS